MKNKLIDRYNKGQSKYKIHAINKHGVSIDGKLTYTQIHDFLNNPEYGWRETFDKDSDWQKEFKVFMKTKTIRNKKVDTMRFVYFNDEHIKDTWVMQTKICYNSKYFGDWSWFNIPMTKEMLAGYIQEFIEEIIK